MAFFLFSSFFWCSIASEKLACPVTRVAQQVATTLTQLSEVLPKSTCPLHTSVVPFSRDTGFQNLMPASPYCATCHPHMGLTDTNCLFGSLSIAALYRVLPAGYACYQAQLCPLTLSIAPAPCSVRWFAWSLAVPHLHFVSSSYVQNQMCSAKQEWLLLVEKT